ncbi:HEAT repeat domain-containing protein [Chitinophaga lutea]|uniref:HEAT repeat domain-containing protein n=1 Tax=Chitinophaga lutea TaxID=2488634 RepID=A0A3N4PM24_9BACT|nr:HEAT repeat domain-containing protein [Chitinophaga lutea]
MIAIILVATSIYLRVKKRRFLQEKKIQDFFDHWLSQALLDDFSGGVELQVPEELKDLPRNKIGRQYAINQLINTKKNLIGVAARNVIYLYEHLGLQSASMAKFNSAVWHRKAKGIYELYMMEQQSAEQQIQKYTNSSNEYVRLEAQTAVLAFGGFKGLRFLNTLTHPMNNWQQVKLLDQLLALDPGHFEELPKWLQSPVDSVVEFSLKLAEIYQQMQVKAEATACLEHPSPKVREQAIKTLTRIGDEESAATLAQMYPTAGDHLQKAILDALEHIATDNERGFLQREYEQGDPANQLQIARIIANCCTGGLQWLQQKGEADAAPYHQIFLHVKYQLARE